ncbi:bifunctional copper resistance protein CopD/cytochrome c oxidase assembly protein [Actinomadura syzygii]|uniref:Bifunctional copper resistance protein CopD/cytochrome c oxidase assembly protein n=1 Tax=Actinomadura syzygii TaxID=1427538 RepID=A0A5D0U848_9ACTN|nr:bifunctional copper resistance protein CopD/cytochrome c oxidase assembly protein [Actinomadura syzygii]
MTDRTMLAIGAAALALVVLAVVVRVGGAFSASATPGLSQSGALTKAGLSVAELGGNAAAVLTVGWLLVAAVFVREPSPVVRRCLRGASATALLWALCTLALIVFTVLDLFGTGPADLTGGMMRTFLVELPQGRALLLVLAIAVALAVAASLPGAPRAAGYLLVGALAGLLPPLLTGHAANASNHTLAVYSLIAHVGGVALWIGGLVALVTVAPDVRLAEVAGRYSSLALGSFLVVGASGAVNAWVRLGGLHLGSRYGTLVVAKAVALAVLGAFGWWHRRASLPALRDGRGPRGFVRLAAAEILVMAATMALATGLSRTPPPENAPGTLDVVALRLGFPLPGPPGVRPYLLDWWPDPLFAVLIAAGAVLYGTGLARVRDWPWRRTASWTAGLLVVLFATCGGLSRYSMVLFSAHAVQHVLVGVVAPPLLLYGAPQRLASRALRGDNARLLAEAAGSRAVRALAHPITASALLPLTLYGWYVSPFFGASLANHALHSLALALFLVVGLAYFHGTAGTLMPFAVLPLHAVAGIALLRDGAVLGGWYEDLGRRWGPPPLHDQRLGALLLWTLSAAVTLAVAEAQRRHWRRAYWRGRRSTTRLSASTTVGSYSAAESSLSRSSTAAPRSRSDESPTRSS